MLHFNIFSHYERYFLWHNLHFAFNVLRKRQGIFSRKKRDAHIIYSQESNKFPHFLAFKRRLLRGGIGLFRRLTSICKGRISYCFAYFKAFFFILLLNPNMYMRSNAFLILMLYYMIHIEGWSYTAGAPQPSEKWGGSGGVLFFVQLFIAFLGHLEKWPI